MTLLSVRRGNLSGRRRVPGENLLTGWPGCRRGKGECGNAAHLHIPQQAEQDKKTICEMCCKSRDLPPMVAETRGVEMARELKVGKGEADFMVALHHVMGWKKGR